MKFRPRIARGLLALFGGTLLLGSLTACAGRHGWHEAGADSGAMRAHMVERIGRKLDLDADQRQRLDTLAGKLQSQRQAMRGDAADPRAPWRALFAGPTFDQAAATRLVDEKTAAVRSGSPEVIAALADFYDHLRPAQQQQVRDFIERRGGRWSRHG